MPVASPRQRAEAVARMAPQTMFAFAVRMAPAFGVGGVMNSSLTEWGRAALRERYALAEPAADAAAPHVEVVEGHAAGPQIRTHLHSMVSGQKLTS